MRRQIYTGNAGFQLEAIVCRFPFDTPTATFYVASVFVD